MRQGFAAYLKGPGNRMSGRKRLVPGTPAAPGRVAKCARAQSRVNLSTWRTDARIVDSLPWCKYCEPIS